MSRYQDAFLTPLPASIPYTLHGVLVYRVDATKPTGQNPVVVFPKENLEAGATYLPGDTFQSEEAPMTLRVEKKLADGGYRVIVEVSPATNPPLRK